MSQAYTTGSWKPAAGRQDIFVAAWSQFGAWDRLEAVWAWTAAPEFRDLLARVLQPLAEFEASERKVVATAGKKR